MGLTELGFAHEQSGRVYPVSSVSLKSGKQEAFVAWSQTGCQTHYACIHRTGLQNEMSRGRFSGRGDNYENLRGEK